MCYYYPEVKQLHKTLITPIIFPDLLLAALVCWDIWTIPIPPTSKKKSFKTYCRYNNISMGTYQPKRRQRTIA